MISITVGSLTMIQFRYFDGIPFNREMSEIIGIDYANNKDSVRVDPIRVEIEEWTESVERVCPNSNDCNNDCQRCASNDGFDSEVIEFRANNKTFSFRRTKGHQLGHIWSSWYDESYAITPAK